MNLPSSGVKGAAAVMLKQNLHVRLLTKSAWSEYIILVAERQYLHMHLSNSLGL